MIVVGDVNKEDALSHLGFLQKMPGNKISLPVLPAAPAASKRQACTL